MYSCNNFLHKHLSPKNAERRFLLEREDLAHAIRTEVHAWGQTISVKVRKRRAVNT